MKLEIPPSSLLRRAPVLCSTLRFLHVVHYDVIIRLCVYPMSSILPHDSATYNVYHVVCDRNTTIDNWPFFSAHTFVCGVVNVLANKIKFYGHHLLYNLYVSFLKHVNELLLDFPKIKGLFKQVRVQPSSTTNLASDCLGATLCIINEFCVPRANIELYKESFLYHGPRLWNTLPGSLKVLPELGRF